MPQPDRGGQVFQADDAIDEAISLGRVVRRAQFEDQLVLFAEIDLLHMAALVEVPEMQFAAVLAAEQQFRN